MTFTFLINLFLIALVINIASACSCFPPNATQQFCLGTFTGIVNVVSGPTDCNNSHCYEVTVGTTFKCLDGQVVDKITTPSNSAGCGVRFTPGAQYLVMGKPDSEGSLPAFSCGYRLQWSSLSDEEKEEKTIMFETMKCE